MAGSTATSLTSTITSGISTVKFDNLIEKMKKCSNSASIAISKLNKNSDNANKCINALNK